MSSSPPETYNPAFHGDFENCKWLPKLPFRSLGNTGLNVCTLGIGGTSFSEYYGSPNYEQAKDTTILALKAGLNFIDTSPWYQNSEKALGGFLKDIPRECYYIATKAGRNATATWEDRFDFSASAVLKNVENSFTRLAIPNIDIIHVHDAEFSLNADQIINETIPALESVVRTGKVKYIGITGYDLEFMKKIAEATHLDALLCYSRFNLNDTALEDYMPTFESKQIGVINASPVSMGLFTSVGPPPWHPSSAEVKEIAKDSAIIAKKYGKTIEEASLGFSLRPDNKHIATTMVSMPTEEILKQNLDVVAKPVTAEDRAMYAEIKKSFKDRAKGPTDWTGVEINEYKYFLGVQ